MSPILINNSYDPVPESNPQHNANKHYTYLNIENNLFVKIISFQKVKNFKTSVDYIKDLILF